MVGDCGAAAGEDGQRDKELLEHTHSEAAPPHGNRPGYPQPSSRPSKSFHHPQLITLRQSSLSDRLLPVTGNAACAHQPGLNPAGFFLALVGASKPARVSAPTKPLNYEQPPTLQQQRSSLSLSASDDFRHVSSGSGRESAADAIRRRGAVRTEPGRVRGMAAE